MIKLITNSIMEAIKLNTLCLNDEFNEKFKTEYIIPLPEIKNEPASYCEFYTYSPKENTEDYNNEHKWLWDGKDLIEGDADIEITPLREFLLDRENYLNNSIHIVGKIQQGLLKECNWLNNEYDWYFIRYSPKDFKIGTIFTLDDNEAILKEVQIQFPIPNGKKLSQIDRGWKTICRFEFKNPYITIETDNWFNNSGERWLEK